LILEAERLARAKVEAGNGTPTLRVELAAAAVLRNDTAGALDWLERAFEAEQRDYGSLAVDPIFARLRGEARFRTLMDRMRRDVDAQRARASARGLLDLTPLLEPAK